MRAGQASEILADLNDIDVVNQAPINHKDDYMRDYMMDKTNCLMINFWMEV